MTFEQFCGAFATLWLEDETTQEVKFQPWTFWEGVNGEPGQMDVAKMLERCKITWVPKARQKGISELWSLYCAFILMRTPRSDAAVFSADKGKGKEFLKKRFNRKIEGLYAVFPEIPWPRWEFGTERAECENGSYVQIYSSDNTGARSLSPRLTLLDEAREYASSDLKDMLATIFPVLRASNQLAVVSSGKSGSYFNEYTNLLKGGIQKPSSVWFGAIKDIEMIFLNDYLDPTHRGTWREDERKKYADEVRFKMEHPETISDIFSSHEGLVIPSWDEGRHVFAQDVWWEPQHEFYAIYDHGSTDSHPAVLHLAQYDPYTDFIYLFDEVFERGMELTEVCKRINNKIADCRALWVLENQSIKPAIKPYGDVRGLYGARHIDEIMLQETGLQFIAVHKRDEEGALELTKARFHRGNVRRQDGSLDRTGGIGIHPKMRNSIKQISNLRYKEGKDEPEELENDALDDVKYLCYIISKREPTPEPTYEQKQQSRIDEWKATQAAVPTTVDRPAVDVNKSWLTV